MSRNFDRDAMRQDDEGEDAFRLEGLDLDRDDSGPPDVDPDDAAFDDDLDGQADVDDEADLDELDDEDGDVGDVGDEVVYDLSAWTLASRTELQSHLVAYGVAHAWVGDELSVKLADEALTDELVAAVDEGRAPTVEPPEDTGDELVYELDDLDEESRELLTERLEEAGVPYAFEDDDGALVVPVAWEATVEEILEEVEFPDAIDVEDDGGADLGADEDGEEGAGRARAASGEVLSELFLAADRLLHDPADLAGLDGLRRALDEIDGAGPPYGVTPALWRRVVQLADELAEQLTDGDDDGAVDRATTLRGLLRPYV